MKNNNNKVFFERKVVWSQKGGTFSLGCPTLLTVFDSLLPFCFLFKRKKRAKSPHNTTTLIKRDLDDMR